MFDVPESVRHRFVEAGWFPGRESVVSPAVPVLHPAARLLAEFGGLTVSPGQTPGYECGTNELEFMEFIELPQYAALVKKLSSFVGSRLIGVAEVCGGHGELFVAADGRFFGRSCIHEASYFEGASFSEAVEGALLGRRARPILLPGQESVSLYGVTYTAESPDLYVQLAAGAPGVGA